MKGDYNVSELLIFIVLGLILFSCGNKEQVSTNPLIGKWVSPNGGDSYWDFTSETQVNRYLRGKEWPGNEEIMVSRAGENPLSTIYGPLNYNYSFSNDTIKFETFGSLNNKTWMKYGALREDNKLYIWNYKGLPGIENHVDEVSYYCLEGDTCSNESKNRIIVIIESGLEGAVHISFDQKDGIPPEFDENKNPIITIDQGSIHKTTLPWHPTYMTDNAFDFMIKDCFNGTLSDINDWGHGDYRNKATDMYKSDTVTFRPQDYQLSAFSLGFNQYARDMLDYEFGEYLNGQVASFSIDYLTDQFVYKEYMKKVKALGEEING